MSGPIRQNMQFKFRLEGTAVVMTINDVDLWMDYPLAFKVAASLRQTAARAKGLAGDMSQHINIVATLTDANADARQEQALRDATIFNPGAMTTRKVN